MHKCFKSMMTSAQVVETSVNVNNNSPSWDYSHPDDQTTQTILTFEGIYLFKVCVVNFFSNLTSVPRTFDLHCRYNDSKNCAKKRALFKLMPHVVFFGKTLNSHSVPLHPGI